MNFNTDYVGIEARSLRRITLGRVSKLNKLEINCNCRKGKPWAETFLIELGNRGLSFVGIFQEVHNKTKLDMKSTW